MAIGLDIGSSAVRVVQLEQRRGGAPRLTHYRSAPLTPGAVVDGDVVEPDVVATALRDLWRQAGLRQRAVAVGLASQRVTVRQLDLPALPEAEIAEAVRLQAHDELPIPVDQAVLAHVIVEHPAGGDGPARLRVLLVAVERDMVDRLLTAVTMAKLRPVLVDLDAFAVLRSLAPSPVVGDEVELVVDIGAMVTKVAVHRGGRPLFVRMLRLGGDAATRQLEKVLELPWEDAEKAKLDASAAMVAGDDLDVDDERARVLQTGVERVVTEVANSLDFFRDQHEDVEVRRLVLSGGASLAPKLTERLHAALDLPVDRGDALRGLAAPNGHAEVVEGLREAGPVLAVPVGLAMGLLR